MRYFSLAFCAWLISCSTVFAGTQTGQVTQILKRTGDGLIYFNMSGTHTDKPSCASGYDYWIILDENSNTGKQQLSMLLAARVSGATITVVGSNTCNRWHDGEDVDYIMY